jgi:hypothetical protein
MAQSGKWCSKLAEGLKAGVLDLTSRGIDNQKTDKISGKILGDLGQQKEEAMSGI